MTVDKDFPVFKYDFSDADFAETVRMIERADIGMTEGRESSYFGPLIPPKKREAE